MAPPNPRKKALPADYKTIAAQFAAAKRAKQIEDATRAGRKDIFAEQTHTSAMDRRRAIREAARKAAYERRWLWTVGFWVWMLAVHAAGIFYFTSGFLLTRLVLDEQATCAVSPLGDGSSHVPNPETGCWHPKTFDRAVVVLIDALRYDFTVPVSSDNTTGTQAEIFHNAFPFLYDTAASEPTRAFLRPFIADPPTTTLQRLKGLTTGTLPTFMDMGSNFAGTAIEEDNLLSQLRSLGKTIVHLGDDTWTALFPDFFEPNVSHAYDSFNVWDLHTVDNGVMEHIFPLVENQKESQWDVLIGHCLGVDHAGHRYGPNHPAMREKLQQMDAFIKKLAAEIDDDTLLVVMGDHGMDSKGDHGGESDDEVEAALWMYAKRPLFGRTSPEFVAPPATAKQRPVNQIDLVPTLALLLGIPIPFNNLGWPIEEAFIGPKGDNWENLVTVSELAAAGINRYQKSYAVAQGIVDAAASVQAPPSLLNVLSTPAPAAVKREILIDAFAVLSVYQEETLRTCKDLWARFDVASMVLGIAIMASGVISLLLYTSRRGDTSDDEDDDIALVEDATLDAAEMMLEIQGELAAPTASTDKKGNGASQDDADDSDLHRLKTQHRSLVFAGLLGAVPVFVGGAVWARIAKQGSEPWYAGAGYAALASTLLVSAQLLGIGKRRLWRLLPSSIWGWMAFVFTVSQSVGFASNSYTIWEDSILLFFLATFGFVAALYSLRLATPGERALGIYHSVVFVLLGRLASVSKLCRDEQMPYCTSTYYASANSSTSAIWQLAIPFGVFLLMPTIVRSFYEPTKSYEGLAPPWIGFVFRGGLFMAAVYWTLDAADNGEWWSDTLPVGAIKAASVYVAQTVLGLSLVAGTVAFVWAGPCVSFTARAAPGTNHAQVTVLGYANAHGARYLILVVNLLIAGVQLSKPMGGGALALMLWQILSLLELLDLLKSSPTAPRSSSSVEQSSPASGNGRRAMLASIEEEEETPAAADGSLQEITAADMDTTDATSTTASPSSVAVIGPVILAMLANFHFFTTGHQATLASIQWDSAFIPLFAVRYPWSPLIIAANTFPGHFLAAASVPLLVLWKTGPRRRGGLLTPTSRALAGFVAYFAVEALSTMAWACHLRRHLMLYRVFNPRFMLAAAALLMVDIAAIVIGLVGLRSNTLAISEVFGWLEDY
ncbi:gpi ethanolamine phosphate transferase [Ophiostoma piceae UAMH 11346]|uniref:Gpi ethanolamine phosphate transferase n=1 Tax=Ophiostoma piceae (strain UAMH 11346) TaxID=1262450 RepID=S3CB32_OPHP1|nr:gpi ethanolamine phosphate transferase [Ophiostoma piceae UAMH 11346]